MEKKTGLGRREFIRNAAITGATVGVAGAASAVGTSPASAAERVPQQVLGATGAKLPILQQGTSQRLDQRYDKVLHLCYREGVTAIDTALSYGWGASHRAVNTFVKQVGNRKNLWLTSKSYGESPKRFKRDCDEARKTLGVEYLDLFLMHGVDDRDMLRPEMLKAGEQLRKSGKTRFFGFSCHDDTVVELMNRAVQVGGIDAILFRYNFRRYGDKALNRAMDACKKAGIGLVAMKTNGGVSSREEKVLAFKSKNFTLGQAKLKSVWADERIDSVLSEMDSLRVARENIAAARSPKALGATEMHQLNRLAAMTSHLACQGCGNLCEGAAGGGLAIADTLRFLSYAEAYGDKKRARRLYGALPAGQRIQEGADLTSATAACPQGIDIAARMDLASRVLAG